MVRLKMVGGLLGQWACWTHRAVALVADVKRIAGTGKIAPEMLTLAAQITDANGAIFDAANNFAGCIPGIHEVLRGQGLMRGTWCLDPQEKLSPGQREEIDRVREGYAHLHDDAFVAEHRDEWLR